MLSGRNGRAVRLGQVRRTGNELQFEPRRRLRGVRAGEPLRVVGKFVAVGIIGLGARGGKLRG